MLRRLLNDLQQRIEGRNGEHVDLVDDVHALFHLAGSIDGIITQVADIVNAVVGGGVDLQNVHTGSGIDGPACLTDVAGVAVMGIEAVDRLRQNLGAAGLTRTARAGKQVRMAHMPGQQLGLQGLRHSPLTNHIIKGLRPILSI